MDTQEFAREMGPQLITFLKVIFIFSFVVLSVIDRDITWFKRQPGLTIGEAILAGLCSSLSFAIVGKMRGAQNLGSLFGVSFVVFTALQILFEISGFNELTATSDTGSKKFARAEKVVAGKKWVWILAVIVFVVVSSFAIVAWDSPPVDWMRFALEGLVIGLGSAIPSIMVTKDRGGGSRDIVTNFTFMLILFGAVAHPFLQYSGMYREFGFMPYRGSL